MGVLAKADEADAIQARLTELGGTAEVHEVAEEVVAEADTAAPAVEEAQAAAGDDLTIIDGIGPDSRGCLNAAGVDDLRPAQRADPRGSSATTARNHDLQRLE